MKKGNPTLQTCVFISVLVILLSCNTLSGGLPESEVSAITEQDIPTPTTEEVINLQPTEYEITSNCPYRGSTDADTITNLINEEAIAINTEDISIIRDIFAPNAILRYVVEGEEWHDPISYYLNVFENMDFQSATHFGIAPTGNGIADDTAWFISGSSGTIIPKNGQPINYYNEPGKDEWVLKRNHNGCWMITEFSFH
jgi:hypothetical protein